MNLQRKHNIYRDFSLLLMAVICLTAIKASAQTHLEAKAESFYTQHKADKAFDLYNKLLKKDINNVNALWHSSLLYSRLGSRLNNEGKKKKYYHMAKRRAMRALKHEHKNSMANYAMAVALGHLAVISSDIEEKISASRKIRKYAIRALKVNHANDGAWDVLSQWNYGFASMNPTQRSVAKAILGDIVKKTSYQKAAKYAKKAIKYNPSMITYYRDLAKAYEGLGKSKKALTTCKKALSKSPVWKEGKKSKEICQNLIKNISDKS